MGVGPSFSSGRTHLAIFCVQTLIPHIFLNYYLKKKKKKLVSSSHLVFIYLFIFMRLSHVVKRISSYPLLFCPLVEVNPLNFKILNFRPLIKSFFLFLFLTFFYVHLILSIINPICHVELRLKCIYKNKNQKIKK